MATNPSLAVCTGCGAPLAPGAKFCGGCGRTSGGAPIPPGGGYAPPPPIWHGAAETVIYAGPPDRATPRLAAALAQAGATVTGAIPGGFRFHHGSYGGRMTGEATIGPDGAGNSIATVGMQLDKGSFWVVAAIGLAVNLLFVTMVPILLLPMIGAFAALYAWLNGGWSRKKRESIMAAVRQAAGMPPPGYAAGFHPPPPAYPASPAPMPPAPAASPTDRLRELAARREQGLLTPEEFDRAKAAIFHQLH